MQSSMLTDRLSSLALLLAYKDITDLWERVIRDFLTKKAKKTCILLSGGKY